MDTPTVAAARAAYEDAASRGFPDRNRIKLWLALEAAILGADAAVVVTDAEQVAAKAVAAVEDGAAAVVKEIESLVSSAPAEPAAASAEPTNPPPPELTIEQASAMFHPQTEQAPATPATEGG